MSNKSMFLLPYKKNLDLLVLYFCIIDCIIDQQMLLSTNTMSHVETMDYGWVTGFLFCPGELISS